MSFGFGLPPASPIRALVQACITSRVVAASSEEMNFAIAWGDRSRLAADPGSSSSGHPGPGLDLGPWPTLGLRWTLGLGLG